MVSTHAVLGCQPERCARQGFMDVVAGALIVVDTTWVQAAILAHATAAQYTLTRAVVLASRAGRLARLMRHLNLLQGLHARSHPHLLGLFASCAY